MKPLNNITMCELFIIIDFCIERPLRSNTFLDLHHNNWKNMILHPINIFV